MTGAGPSTIVVAIVAMRSPSWGGRRRPQTHRVVRRVLPPVIGYAAVLTVIDAIVFGIIPSVLIVSIAVFPVGGGVTAIELDMIDPGPPTVIVAIVARIIPAAFVPIPLPVAIVVRGVAGIPLFLHPDLQLLPPTQTVVVAMIVAVVAAAAAAPPGRGGGEGKFLLPVPIIVGALVRAPPSYSRGRRCERRVGKIERGIVRRRRPRAPAP
mmetsp:Transcript_4502/g.9740  ORF Transcript_4502/g.9740 Transcript_4502/m.9740 type:complete len:210 (+) Transcript_4502:1025-1654(+)